MSDPHKNKLRQLETRNAELAAGIESQKEEMRRVSEELKRVVKENALLREKLDALARRIFGKKSEQLSAEQLMLLLQEPGSDVGKTSASEAGEALPPRPQRACGPGRRERTARLPEHLPVVEEVIEPEAVKADPQAWRRIGEEISERLDYEPGRFLRRRVVRPKYVKKGEVDGGPLIAPLPESLLERSIVSPGLLAQIVVSKYCDHLPLYRQESIFWSRHQVWLPRQTMAEWMGLAADWLKPIYERIKTGVMGGGYVQIDETPIRYMEPGHGKTKLGYMWTCCRPTGDVAFHWETSRATECLEKIVPVDFSGTVQCDGYQAYRRFARGRGDEVTLAGCMAHARRGFFEGCKQSPRVAGFILRQFQQLYAVEKKLRESKAGPRLREAVRASESRPILERLHRLFVRLKTKGRFLPQSLLGQAMDYTLGQWKELCVFLTDGRVEIDNNLVENAIRPTAVGKKNWLFIGEAHAGERGAIIYTLIESCRRRGIDPYAYLRDVFARLPSMTNWQVKDITPEAWLKAHRNASLSAAA